MELMRTPEGWMGDQPNPRDFDDSIDRINEDACNAYGEQGVNPFSNHLESCGQDWRRRRLESGLIPKA